MGDTNHLARFREGARSWNAWRAQHPGITPDLRDVAPNLGEKQLGPAHGGPIDLSDVFLNGANLRGATLLEARLGNSDLRQANLSMALLAGADLSFANLGGAVLDHADLTNACLRGAILEGASLALVRNLTQAQLDATVGDADTVLPPDLRIPSSWIRSEPFADPDLPFDRAMDPYGVLGLSRKASPEEIRAAYVKLVKKHHPDVNPGDLAAERRIKQINEAYHRLTAPAYHLPQSPNLKRPASWGAAAALFVGALLAPSLALYFLGMPPFKFEQRKAPQHAEQSATPAPKVAVLHPAAQPATEYTGALPVSPPAMEAASGQQDITSSVEVPAPEAVHRAEPNLALLREPEMERINLEEAMQFAIQRPARDLSSPPLAQSAALEPVPSPLTEAAKNLSENAEEPKNFVREPEKENTPGLSLMKRQLALLVERETTEGDQRAWDETRERGTAAALRAYISGYPSGTHVDQAEEKLAAIEEQAFDRKRDSSAWNKAQREGTLTGYEAYLRAEPDGRHVGDAKRKIAAAQLAARRENAAWGKANREHTRGDYRALNAVPKRRYASASQDAMSRTEQEPQVGPRRAALESRRSGPGWPSPDEPVIERIQRTQ